MNQEFVKAIIETAAVTGFMSAAGAAGGFIAGKTNKVWKNAVTARGENLLMKSWNKGT